MTHRGADFVVHVAGEPMGSEQRCVACRTVLIDNSPWFEGRVMVPVPQHPDDEMDGPTWWPAGARVATDKQPGGCASVTYLVERGELAEDERPCVGVN